MSGTPTWNPSWEFILLVVVVVIVVIIVIIIIIIKTVHTNLNLQDLTDFQDDFFYLMVSQQQHDISLYL